MADNHAQTIAGISKQLRKLMEESNQAIYVYIDDKNKVCNQNMADMLEYPNPAAWAAVTTSFPKAFVDKDSQETIVDAFQDAMNNGNGCAIPVTWKTKEGHEVESDVLLVPMEYEGHRYALHFIEPVE